MINRGKLLAWSILIFIGLSVSGVYGAYILKNNGYLYVDAATFYIDNTQFDTYVTSLSLGSLDAAPADHAASGLTASMTVGETVTIGQALYMKSDGKLWKSDANTSTTMPVVAVATTSITANNAGTVLTQGFIHD